MKILRSLLVLSLLASSSLAFSYSQDKNCKITNENKHSIIEVLTEVGGHGERLLGQIESDLNTLDRLVVRRTLSEIRDFSNRAEGLIQDELSRIEQLALGCNSGIISEIAAKYKKLKLLILEGLLNELESFVNEVLSETERNLNRMEKFFLKQILFKIVSQSESVLGELRHK